MPERTVKTGWYRFHQNNSGGYLIGPAENVHIEAIDAEHACGRAEEVGIYFNGVRDGKDCPCCGDRWYRPYEDPTDVPMNYECDGPVENDDENLILPLTD